MCQPGTLSLFLLSSLLAPAINPINPGTHRLSFTPGTLLGPVPSHQGRHQPLGYLLLLSHSSWSPSFLRHSTGDLTYHSDTPENNWTRHLVWTVAHTVHCHQPLPFFGRVFSRSTLVFSFSFLPLLSSVPPSSSYTCSRDRSCPLLPLFTSFLASNGLNTSFFSTPGGDDYPLVKQPSH